MNNRNMKYRWLRRPRTRQLLQRYIYDEIELEELNGIDVEHVRLPSNVHKEGAYADIPIGVRDGDTHSKIEKQKGRRAARRHKMQYQEGDIHDN